MSAYFHLQPTDTNFKSRSAINGGEQAIFTSSLCQTDVAKKPMCCLGKLSDCRIEGLLVSCGPEFAAAAVIATHVPVKAWSVARRFCAASLAVYCSRTP